ncbi:acyl-CoA thioesterase [Denitratisoma oestradiolicum]|uniref:Acyl-CoA thioesterase n=1 Tax=Denitratisoma oestradiolicum TaxID=311182 RepID=A0A6S6Y5M6_9PROT|nr:acyl-CoA thioesterase [Denitratisoma oestradiolicum]TWO81164.1 acyl-CoA thioesterase [Denitratisoma oestradiolicum]CAB1367858.1 Acyl-CoA thioesterase [Denitratisoma oestradiolicum]
MNDELQLPSRQPTLRVMPQVKDTNPNGDIFGGWVMSQVDLAAGACAARVARGRAVTVAVNSFQFKQPIAVGDVVSFYADVVKVGRTSVTVDVQVYAERFSARSICRVVKVTEAVLTFVAVNEDGSKREIPAEFRSGSNGLA